MVLDLNERSTLITQALTLDRKELKKLRKFLIKRLRKSQRDLNKLRLILKKASPIDCVDVGSRERRAEEIKLKAAMAEQSKAFERVQIVTNAPGRKRHKRS